MDHPISSSGIDAESPAERGEQLRCSMCGHTWTSRLGKRPVACPGCHSTKWGRSSARQVKCQRCGHIWITGDVAPLRCPSCKSKKWEPKLIEVRCKVCGRRWSDPMRSGEALACPGCGQSSRKGMVVSNRPRKASELACFSPSSIEEMRRKKDERSKIEFLTGRGMTTEEAQIVVRFDSGMRVVPISMELNVSLESVMDAVIPFMDACKEAGLCG